MTGVNKKTLLGADPATLPSSPNHTACQQQRDAKLNGSTKKATHYYVALSCIG
ncbi:hypothetical protein [Carboxylicivirga mesophila]|uniref:hypothetical protein n=1 Tax=Carboxylicivirga mesophila TaxID=1166478 RepID=UPI001BA9042B|nr:hypothetical protein [Carboxylicivirga mesophila]